VQVEVPETSLAAVTVGAPVKTFLDAFPERAYTGRVQRIWPTANRQKATVEVRASFDAPDDRLRPEMGVRVVFGDGEAETPGADDPAAEGAAGPVILIPADCVVRQDGRDGVFVLERDVARWRPVSLGRRRSGSVVVETGLEDGERVVTTPPASLSDGDRVLLES